MVQPNIPIIKKRKHRIWLILSIWSMGGICLLIAIIFDAHSMAPTNIYSQIFGFTGLILIGLNVFLWLVLKKFSIIGHIGFMPDKIIVNGKEYLLKDLQHICFSFYGCEGQPHPTAITGGLTPKSGMSNYFSFHFNSEKYSYELYFGAISWLYFILNIFQEWKNQKKEVRISGVSRNYLDKFSL
jgi:hypothetical protein